MIKDHLKICDSSFNMFGTPQYSQYLVYEDMVQKLLPFFLSFYLGAWCDMFGRKYILYYYFFNRCLSQAVAVLNAYFIEAKAEYYLLVSVPIALAGK